VISRQLAAAFLVAYAAVVSLSLGVLAMMMIALLTTATWFSAIRRRAELVIAALPALAALGVLLLPAVLALQSPPDPADRPRHIYMNSGFVIARTIVYWGAWLAIGESLLATSRLQRRGEAAEAARRFRVISCAGLIVLSLTMTFASFDWMMSLTPQWYSTIFGVYWFGGGIGAALALLTLLARPNAVQGMPDSYPALGKLMLTFVMFWVYIGFAQYIVIWSGDIPVEVTWHAARTHGSWGGVALALLLGAAVVFLALLSRTAKTRRTLLVVVGVLLLALHYLDTYWMIIPGLVPVTWWLVALSAATTVVVGGLTLVLARLRMRTI
jgi:hypothetical protein